jgi:hypothetical protein
MTFAELLTTLERRGALPPSRLKDCKTSLTYLATALGYDSLAHCPVDTSSPPPATWGEALETHFTALEAEGRTISAATRRNTRNNIRVILRLAETHGLRTAPLPPLLLARPRRHAFRRQQHASAPYQATYRSQVGPRYYALPERDWPPDIQAEWQHYLTECDVRLRATTLATTARCLTLYLGYLAHVVGRTPTWADVVSVAEVRGFVRWHGARVGRPVSAFGWLVTCKLAAIAVALQHPHARAMADFRNALQAPEPVHVKRQHMLSLAQLEAVAEACLTAGRLPPVVDRRARHPGMRRASLFQKGVILKLLVRVPLRQRNVRELRLGDHLYQDEKGHWHLHLSGRDLKVGMRGAQPHVYHLNLTELFPEWVAVLEEWLTVQRPRLPRAQEAPWVFLTIQGKAFTSRTLGGELKEEVAMRTGVRFYPHLIRTIWATEYLEATQNFAVAATMLGDTIGMVMKTYYDIVNKDQHAKARDFLRTALAG